MHADDIIIISMERKVAEDKVRHLENYCELNNIRLQPKKCSFIVINKTDDIDYSPIVLKKGKIENTTSEVYLESTITNSTKLSNDIEADVKRGNINIIKYYGFLRENKNAPLQIKLKVLQACTLSGLLFNCETRGNGNLQKLEVRYRKMWTSILGVRVTTCNDFIYIELGQCSIETQVRMQQFNFWKRVKTLNKDEPLQRLRNHAKEQNINISQCYDELLTNYDNVNEIKEEFFEKIKCSITRKAESGQSRYIMYNKVNPSMQIPNIYNHIKIQEDVRMIAELRTGSNKLKVETGRHSRIPREYRLCTGGQIARR